MDMDQGRKRQDVGALGGIKKEETEGLSGR